MKQNNQNTNIPIMLDSKNPSNQNSLLQYETHIRLMCRYAIATLMFMLIVCLLTGCQMRQFIYPDSKEFARICHEAREKGFAGILYDEKLQPNSEQNFDYLYRLYGNVEMGRKDYMLGRDRERLSNIYKALTYMDQARKSIKKDYIFGEDRTESNIIHTITYADKERINKIKKDIRGLKGNKEYVVTLTDSYGYPMKRDRESSIRYLEQELFLLENYYGETIEQRIDKTSLITKKEFLIRNKKTKAIAFKGISYNLYADREMSISSRKDPAKVEYKPKPGYDSSIKYEQEPIYYCVEMSILKEPNEAK
ncbi:hypothetical protein [Helicobacter trogontum]|uniref:Uncharacterized protein n=1 Tax=Helicobacter trogontum TaxID=50960 RepID=A0A4V6HYA4_9HELI|nr:hypothetical protein [Helicobacter trogontum]TLD79672.1 hypothetical protein LS81_010545 [Helicobacter trogontum]